MKPAGNYPYGSRLDWVRSLAMNAVNGRSYPALRAWIGRASLLWYEDENPDAVRAAELLYRLSDSELMHLIDADDGEPSPRITLFD